MRQARRAFRATLTLVATASLILTVGLAQPAQATIRLGDVDVANYCSVNHGLFANHGSTNDTWTCGYWLPSEGFGAYEWVALHGIDMDLACRQQFGSKAYSVTEGSLYSDWACYYEDTLG